MRVEILAVSQQYVVVGFNVKGIRRLADKLTIDLQIQVQHMVYLGPIIPRLQTVKSPVRPSNVTAVNAYASDQHGADTDAAPAVAATPPGGVERRRQDRRHKSSDPMLETRAGDRRKARHAPINISI